MEVLSLGELRIFSSHIYIMMNPRRNSFNSTAFTNFRQISKSNRSIFNAIDCFPTAAAAACEAYSKRRFPTPGKVQIKWAGKCLSILGNFPKLPVRFHYSIEKGERLNINSIIAWRTMRRGKYWRKIGKLCAWSGNANALWREESMSVGIFRGLNWIETEKLFAGRFLIRNWKK